MYYLEVLIEDVFLNNQTLTYSTNDSTIRAGMRVVVPLRGRRIVAFVMKTAKPYTTAFKVQPIIERLDREPIIDERLMNLAKWMAYETVSPLIRCLQTLLPNKLKPKSSAKKAKQINTIIIQEKK